MGNVACVGDTSSHGGLVISSGQSGKCTAMGAPVAVAGALHSCPQEYAPGVPHGTTPITPNMTKTFIEGKLVITEGAVAGCGAVIITANRKTGVVT